MECLVYWDDVRCNRPDHDAVHRWKWRLKRPFYFVGIAIMADYLMRASKKGVICAVAVSS